MSVINPGSGAAKATGGWSPYLDRGEKLLWEGAPATGLRFRPSDIFLTLFGVFWLGFSLFWTFMAGTMGAAAGGGFSLFGLFGLPFVAVGIYLVGGRFFWDSYARSRTRYALTDRRAIIARSAAGRSLKSWPIDDETRLDYEPGPEATIWFAEEIKRGSKGRTYTEKKGFEYISDGDKVYRLMRDIQQGAIAGAVGGAVASGGDWRGDNTDFDGGNGGGHDGGFDGGGDGGGGGE